VYDICTDCKKDYDTDMSVVLLGASAKNCKGHLLCFSYLPVCPQAVTRSQLDGCLSNLIISLESLETIQVSLKSDKNNGYFTRRPRKLIIISRRIRLGMKNISE